MNNDIPWKQIKNDKKIVGIGIVALVLIAIIVCLFLNFKDTNKVSVETKEEVPQQIQVHVAGSVANPGLYKLDANARIMDAINAAGGFSSDADQSALNLAKNVEDGEQILVSAKTTNVQESSITSNGKININTADATQLQTLNGVGPSTAQKIIDYRTQNGKFKTVDDLKKVSGIGEKTFAKFADKICV